MKRRQLLRLSLLFVLAGAGFTPAAAKPAKAEKRDEMGQYQHILESPVASVQDLVDLIMMTRGDFAKHPSAEERIAEARREGWLGTETAADDLNRGTLALAIVKNYPIDRGLLFRLTHWHHYALRDTQHAGILSVRNSENHKVSGEQLVGAINAAEEFKQEKEQWQANH